LQFDTAQLKFIPILEHVGQVRGQALPIQESAVGATNILDQVGRTPLVDLAMMARNSTLEPSISADVQIGENAVSRIEASNVYLRSGWQLDLTARG